jgi:hypothetical protein
MSRDNKAVIEYFDSADLDNPFVDIKTISRNSTQQNEGPRTLRPPYAHEWQEYMDGQVRCSACGIARWRIRYTNKPCEGAAKVTMR